MTTDLATVTEQKPEKICNISGRIARDYGGERFISNGVILIIYPDEVQRNLAYEELDRSLKKNDVFYLHFRVTKDRLVGDINRDPSKDMGIKEILGKYPGAREKPHITIEEHFC